MHQQIACHARAIFLPAPPPRKRIRIERPSSAPSPAMYPSPASAAKIRRRRILPRARRIIASHTSPQSNSDPRSRPSRSTPSPSRTAPNSSAAPDLHNPIRLLRRRHHRQPIRRRMRHRLLAIHILARAHRVHHHLLMPVVGNRHDDRVDILRVQQFLIRRSSSGSACPRSPAPAHAARRRDPPPPRTPPRAAESPSTAGSIPPSPRPQSRIAPGRSPRWPLPRLESFRHPAESLPPSTSRPPRPSWSAKTCAAKQHLRSLAHDRASRSAVLHPPQAGDPEYYQPAPPLPTRKSAPLKCASSPPKG